MSGRPDSMKGSVMELFNLEVSKYGLNIESYFGDIYIYTHTLFLTIGLLAVLRIAKIIRKRLNKTVAPVVAPVTESTNSIWED